MKPWLTVVGIGDDGLAGLGPNARAMINEAELLVGGDRHQGMIADTGAERLTWAGGLDNAMEVIAKWRGRRVVVLATGDPMCYGAGANLQRRLDPEEMLIIPFPGAFSLAAARMRWSLPDVETLSIHGRPLETPVLVLAPAVRILVLSRDGDSPAQVANLLTKHGFGPSRITVLEHLGGPCERRIDGIAETWSHPRCADLNTLAVECRPALHAPIRARVPGLPDDAFESDGQLTKREVRAATVAALAPLPGQVLWDVGAGNGSIAVEWMRAVPPYRTAAGRCARAIAIERDLNRCAMITRNADALGVPQVEVIRGEAPEALNDLQPRPDTVFVGGGITTPGLLDACWNALASGGRLVANAVTVEGEASLIAFRSRNAGELTRMAVSRTEPVGRLTAFKPMLEVTQYMASKP